MGILCATTPQSGRREGRARVTPRGWAQAGRARSAAGATAGAARQAKDVRTLLFAPVLPAPCLALRAPAQGFLVGVSCPPPQRKFVESTVSATS